MVKADKKPKMSPQAATNYNRFVVKTLERGAVLPFSLQVVQAAAYTEHLYVGRTENVSP